MIVVAVTYLIRVGAVFLIGGGLWGAAETVRSEVAASSVRDRMNRTRP